MTKYDESNWKDLPDAAKKAAGVLGYTKDLWDGDKTPAICNKEWAKLTSAQQDAAKTLGYNATSWDDDSSSSSEE